MPKCYLFAISSLCCLLSSQTVFAQSNDRERIDSAHFKTPPAQNHVHAWWHFVNKSYSKTGITKDLEAMKQQGITETTILNIGLFDGKDLGISNLKYGSPEYFEMFKYALKEAHRLGMTLGIHNCDGWSESGGPWISLENSMKQYTWSKIQITGGQARTLQLPLPDHKLNYYRDVKVLAYKSQPTAAFYREKPVISSKEVKDPDALTDGNPNSTVNVQKGNSLLLKFGQPLEANQLQLHTRKLFAWSGTRQRLKVAISCSDDGNDYRPVATVEDSLVNRNVLLHFPLQRARYYKLSVEDILFNGSAPLELAEIALLKSGEQPLFPAQITNHQAKTVSVVANHYTDFYQPDTAITSVNISHESDVIDLSSKLQPDGTLNWDATGGNWTIIRFGYTTTGAVNAPATKEGEGLECDKMDTTALNVHFNAMPQKLIASAGAYKGNTFKYLFVDSWECYYQNWSKNFEAEFLKRRRYSLTPFIPALCGEVVISPEATEAFLHDFRTTIGDLISQNYYKHLADLCHRNGLELHAEAIYGGIFTPGLDVLKANSYFDVPVTEFWAPLNAADTLLSYNKLNQINSTLPIHAANMYNKAVIASEAYTGFANFSESPWDLKLWGDKGYTSGINQMVLHSYVHQPDDRRPGLTLGIYGSSFNRNNIWWGQAKSWLDYQARIQYLLQKGRVVADVLYYMGDKLPTQQAINKPAELTESVRADFCNTDILMRSFVKNGKVVAPNGRAYPFLMYADSLIELPVLQKMKQLVADGATLISPKPIATLSLFQKNEHDATLKQIAEQVWGSTLGKKPITKVYGKGKVIENQPWDTIYREQHVDHDLEIRGAELSDLMWLHKELGTTEVYYLVNQNEVALNFQAGFRVTGSTPELWDPVTGNVTQLGIYSQQKKRNWVPVQLSPRQSLFIVFKKGDHRHFDQVADLSGVLLFPAQQPAQIPSASYASQQVSLSLATDSRCAFMLTSPTKNQVKVSFQPVEQLPLDHLTGVVQFVDEPRIKELQINAFSPFTQSNDPRIRHYSGTAVYEVEFTIPPVFISKGKRVLLHIDRFGSTASIRLNGSPLVDNWIPGRDVEITAFARNGKNRLQLSVTNPWRNYLLDKESADQRPGTWTTAPALPASYQLLNSGVAGVYLKSVAVDHVDLK